MDKHLVDVLNQQEENHILPFFWQHGETEEVLRKEMQQIRAAGIRAVCVEARPHPDFAGPGWWHDMDIILEEARQHQMQVWVLDDAHFPTGFANGAIRENPHLRKWYLMEKHIDADGPLAGASFLVDKWLNRFDWMHMDEKRFGEDELLAVVALKSDETGKFGSRDAVNLTAQVRNGTLEWDIPEGSWRIFLLMKTRDWGGNLDYINPIDAESVRVLIDAVYEPHWAHYAADFGKTFAGFFSDEPSFGNTKGFAHLEVIGYPDMVLPWSNEMPTLLAEQLGTEWINKLPALWHDIGDTTRTTRFHYMDIVTKLYDQHFGSQLGKWCEAHGVSYIGHVIEDQNAHARLGCGAGHFFRALHGQHMSGIDYIAQQVLPRLESFREVARGTEPDTEFFHFGLAKMGSSLAHIDPKKQGRCLCEIFGASGWGTGVRRMKWLVDHALVRGINRFVPHAFSAKAFPDHDCPPHFYAHGHNPQFRHFGDLMRYTNRMCHLLDAGVHIAPVAVLYHAEAEWAGEAMFFQKPVHYLARRQIDTDILPADVFLPVSSCQATIGNGFIQVHKERYRALVVPTCSAITSHTARFIGRALAQQFPVIFIDHLPDHIADELVVEKEKALLKMVQDAVVLPIEDLADYITDHALNEISLNPPHPYLRYYHYRRNDQHIWMFNNEHPFDRIETKVEMPFAGDLYRYDARRNRLYAQNIEVIGDKSYVMLQLVPYESCVFISGQDIPLGTPVYPIPTSKAVPILQLDGPWHLSLATAEEYPVFTPVGETCLINQSASNAHPQFSGFFRYTYRFTWEGDALALELDLGQVYDAAEVYVNDVHVGSAFCPPYCFTLDAALLRDSNELRIDVANTLVQTQKDISSMCMALDPSGLLGPVCIQSYKQIGV